MFDVKNIVVPTDFSKLSFNAAKYARDLAEKLNANIHLLYVMDKTLPFIGQKNGETSEESLIKIKEEQAFKQMMEIKEQLFEDLEDMVTCNLRKGMDYEEIVAFTQQVKGDLIVIATHGRTGILHSLLGSVAEKVIRYAKCPVLVINPTEE